VGGHEVTPTARQAARFTGFLNLALALFFVGAAVVVREPEFRWIFLAIAALVGVLAWRRFRHVRTAPPEARAFFDPNTLAPRDRIAHMRRSFLLLTAALGALTAMTVRDISTLESSASNRVSLWAPVGFMYDVFGYWPAVLFAPGLWVVVSCAFGRRWLKARRELSDGQG
jgi:membrane protein implicated in regulation of membrane protease activity